MDSAPFRKYQLSNENPIIRCGISASEWLVSRRLKTIRSVGALKTIKAIGNAHGFPPELGHRTPLRYLTL